MIVEGVQVTAGWSYWPMWSVVSSNGHPLGYVKANTKAEAIEKALVKYQQDGLICRPYDGVL